MLLHLINNILDMSEIENHEMKLKEASFELQESVEKVHTVLEQTAFAKKLTFEVRCEQITNNQLIGDAVRLRQVLMNLLSNSLKFTPPGGKVSLLVRQEGAEENGYAPFIIEVTDTGIGMNITKTILDVMGADLKIESEVGKGTRFLIHVKLKTDSEQGCEEHPESSNIPNLAAKRMLVVEDNDINMEIIVSLLERTQAEIVQAWNAEDALKIFEESGEHYFNLILFNIQLPCMNGYEAVKMIRSMDRNDASKIPILAMTANAFSQDVEQSIQSGMNDHISKPIDIDVLYHKLQTYLS